jgi:hypothetical protein
MPSENKTNKILTGDSNDSVTPIDDEQEKIRLAGIFTRDILEPLAGDTRAFKEAMSGFLFGEARHEAIHGVGIGKIDGKECVRIYFDDHKTDQTRNALQRFLDLSSVDVPIPDPLDDTFAFTLKNEADKKVTIQLVRAPQAAVAALGSGSGVAHGSTRTQVLPIPCNATREYTSLPAGTSIWRKLSAKGTIGYFCKDSNGNKYVLSCNHVLADFASDATPPDFAPLYRDGSGSSIVSLASLSEFVPLNASAKDQPDPATNSVDAALAEISYGIQPRIIEGVKIKGSVAADINQQVEKHGIATCGTIGTVDDISCNMRVNGTNGLSYFFVNQIRIRSNERTKPFAARGDSGSLVFERNSEKAVGLLFAVGNQNFEPSGLPEGVERNVDYALVNPIGEVIAKLTARLNRFRTDNLTLDLIVP